MNWSKLSRCFEIGRGSAGSKSKSPAEGRGVEIEVSGYLSRLIDPTLAQRRKLVGGIGGSGGPLLRKSHIGDQVATIARFFATPFTLDRTRDRAGKLWNALRAGTSIGEAAAAGIASYPYASRLIRSWLAAGFLEAAGPSRWKLAADAPAHAPMLRANGEVLPGAIAAPIARHYHNHLIGAR